METWAILAGGAFAAALAIGAAAGWFFFCGMAAAFFLEARYRKELGLACLRAEQAGHARALRERDKMKRIDETGLPANAEGAEREKSWAEGLAGLYPKDEAVQEAAKKAKELSDFLERG